MQPGFQKLDMQIPFFMTRGLGEHHEFSQQGWDAAQVTDAFE